MSEGKEVLIFLCIWGGHFLSQEFINGGTLFFKQYQHAAHAFFHIFTLFHLYFVLYQP